MKWALFYTMLHKKLSSVKILLKTDHICKLIKCKLTAVVMKPLLITHVLTLLTYSFNRIWDLASLSDIAEVEFFKNKLVLETEAMEWWFCDHLQTCFNLNIIAVNQWHLLMAHTLYTLLLYYQG